MDNNELSDFVEESYKIRQKFVEHLNAAAHLIKSAKVPGTVNQPAQLMRQAKDLEEGVFRIVVIGDYNRGKSSLLNALTGKELLPTKIIACTAILTKIKYGKTDRVAVHFKQQERAPEIFINLKEFAQKYSIPKSERDPSNNQKNSSFPNVLYAEVENDSDLLSNGVELIDTPGLGRSDGDNELTLSYIENCHAVVFVLDAVGQQLSDDDRKYLKFYLNNYFAALGGKLPKVFFVLNLWDQISGRCVTPEEIPEAEELIKNFFIAELAHELKISVEETKGYWGKRMFPTSAKLELQKLRTKNENLGDSGVPSLRVALGEFLRKDKLRTQLEYGLTQIITLTSQTVSQIQRVYANLGESKESIIRKIEIAESGLKILEGTLSNLETLIREKQNAVATRITNDFVTSMRDISNGFEADFHDPETPFWGTKGRMEKYQNDVIRECQRLLEDKIRLMEQYQRNVLEDELKLFSVRILEKIKSYYAEKDKINKKILEKTDKIRSGPGMLIDPLNIDLEGLPVKGISRTQFSFASANTFGILTGVSSGALVTTGISYLFGAALGPVGLGIAVTVTTLVSLLKFNLSQKDEIKKEILKRVKQSVLALSQQKKGEVFQNSKKIFTPANTYLETLQNDLQNFNKGVKALSELEETSSENIDNEEKRLKGLLQELDKTMKNSIKDFEESFDCKITDEDLANIIASSLTSKTTQNSLSKSSAGNSNFTGSKATDNSANEADSLWSWVIRKVWKNA